MVLILSPAKTLNFKGDSPTLKYSQPIFAEEAYQIVKVMQKLSPMNLQELMGISNGLSELNYLRYQKWEQNHNTENSKQAIFTFNGEVYNGLQAHGLNTEQLLFAQKHVRMLSGLYGILKPLDLIQPYRLEMGTKLTFESYKNLYSFWEQKINKTIQEELIEQRHSALINLASIEYSKAVILKKVKAKVITPIFKELKGDDYKTITVYAKRARGLMTRFIIENKIDKPNDIKIFDSEGYGFSSILSTESEWVFVR